MDYINNISFKTLLVLLCITQLGLSDTLELQKLIWLSGQVRNTDCVVKYGSSTYTCKQVGTFGMVFLRVHYKGETAISWIRKWCSTTRSGKTVWVKYSDGSYELARDALVNKLSSYK